MKKIISRTLVLGLVSLALLTAKVNAQESVPLTKSTTNAYYKNAIGLRAGETSGLTYKHRTQKGDAVEIILGTFPYAFSLTGLYEKYMPTGLNGLQWYFGGGGHVTSQLINTYGYYVYNEKGRYYYYRTYSYGPAVGIDGIIGIEYKIPRAPFAFSFDLKPNLEVVPGSAVYSSLDPGLGVKVTF